MSAVNAEKIQKGFKNMSDFMNEPEEMEPVEIEETEETAGEVTDSTEETPTAETVSKFRELTSNRMKMIGQQLFQMKKIPEKRSLTGVKSFFVVSVKAVPESSEPIRNAPNADEKPILVARTTMLRQRHSEKMSSVSEVR